MLFWWQPSHAAAPVTPALGPGRHIQHQWLELWPAQHMDLPFPQYPAMQHQPFLPLWQNLPPEASTTSAHRDGAGCVGATMAWPNHGKRELLWWELVLPTLRAGDHGGTAGGGGQNIVVKAETAG